MATSNVPASLPSLPALGTLGYSPRSYARAPTQRPYLLNNNRASAKVTKPVIGDTKVFADKVAFLVEKRAGEARLTKGLGAATSTGNTGKSPSTPGQLTERTERTGRSLGGAGSFSSTNEFERAELIIDYPVWSPGSFQDLSTLHALRETTLAHTHALIDYLAMTHNIPASYRLLTRSATSSSSPPSCTHAVGWGCIRLMPTVTSPVQHRAELRPAVRRTSSVGPRPIGINQSHGHGHHRRTSSKSQSSVHAGSPLDDVPQFRLDFEEAIADEDEGDDIQVELRDGFSASAASAGSASASDSEEEEECADTLIAREVEKRNLKEG